MNQATNTVAISIMGREFKISCPKDKVTELENAANYLSNKMQEIQLGDKTKTIDRIAITAALNVIHELQTKTCDFDTLNKKIIDLDNKINKALTTKLS